LAEASGSWGVSAGVSIEVYVHAHIYNVDIPFEAVTLYSNGDKRKAIGIVRS